MVFGFGVLLWVLRVLVVGLFCWLWVFLWGLVCYVCVGFGGFYFDGGFVLLWVDFGWCGLGGVLV